MKHSPQVEAVHQRLDTYLAQSTEESLLGVVRRSIEDPLCPRSKNGRFRPSPIMLLLGILTALATLTFLCFTAIRP